MDADVVGRSWAYRLALLRVVLLDRRKPVESASIRVPFFWPSGRTDFCRVGLYVAWCVLGDRDLKLGSSLRLR